MKKLSRLLIIVLALFMTLGFSGQASATTSSTVYTQLSQLPAGSLVEDPGSKYNGAPVVWRVVDQGKAYPGCTTLMTAYAIISPRNLNSAEPGFPGSLTRTYGYAEYDAAIVNRWLNSESSTDWVNDTQAVSGGTTTYTYPNRPAYATEKAFPLNFSYGFMKEVKQSNITILKYDSKQEYSGTMTLKMNFFLPSASELYMQANSGKEGKPMAYFYSYVNRQMYTPEGVHVSYWTRSPFNTLPYIAYAMQPNGSMGASSVSVPRSVLPMTNLDPATPIGSQNAKGIYILNVPVKK